MSYRCRARRCPGHALPDDVCRAQGAGASAGYVCDRVEPPCPGHAAADHRCRNLHGGPAFSCGRAEPPCGLHARRGEACGPGRFACHRVTPPCEGHRRPGLVCPPWAELPPLPSSTVAPAGRSARKTTAAHPPAPTVPVQRPLAVGVNLPWTHTYCGYDFGPPPPGWRARHPSPRDFEAELGPTFDRLVALGVSVVRVFVLGDCIAYPAPDAYDARLRVPRTGFERPIGRPTPPPLDPLVLADVRALLDAAHRRRLRVLPSMLSFEAFAPPKRLAGGVVKQGRGALVLGDRERGDDGAIAAFLDAVLDPLLALRTEDGAPHPAVLAWEVANEPDWCVKHGHVGPEALDRYLGAAVRRVTEAGYTASVGFVRPEASFVPNARLAEWAELARAGRYLHQLHHYPQNSKRRLPEATKTRFGEATVIGEFPLTDRPKPGFVDPELAATERDPDRYLVGRLELAERRGYRLALAWSLHASDANSGLDAGVERQLRAFTHGA